MKHTGTLIRTDQGEDEGGENYTDWGLVNKMGQG